MYGSPQLYHCILMLQYSSCICLCGDEDERFSPHTCLVIIPISMYAEKGSIFYSKKELMFNMLYKLRNASLIIQGE